MDSLLTLLQMTLSLLSLLNSSSTIPADVRLQISQATTQALTLIEQVDPSLINSTTTTTTMMTIPNSETVSTQAEEIASSTPTSTPDVLDNATTTEETTSTKVEIPPKDFRKSKITNKSKVEDSTKIEDLKFYRGEDGFLHVR
jgi:hypothetical protein